MCCVRVCIFGLCCAIVQHSLVVHYGFLGSSHDLQVPKMVRVHHTALLLCPVCCSCSYSREGSGTLTADQEGSKVKYCCSMVCVILEHYVSHVQYMGLFSSDLKDVLHIFFTLLLSSN